MRAGLAPRLTWPGVAEGVDGWRVAVMRVGEGETMFAALARALMVAGGYDDPGGFDRAAATPWYAAVDRLRGTIGHPR